MLYFSYPTLAALTVQQTICPSRTIVIVLFIFRVSFYTFCVHFIVYTCIFMMNVTWFYNHCALFYNLVLPYNAEICQRPVHVTYRPVIPPVSLLVFARIKTLIFFRYCWQHTLIALVICGYNSAGDKKLLYYSTLKTVYASFVPLQNSLIVF